MQEPAVVAELVAWAQTHPALVGAAAAVLVLGTAGLLLLLRRRRPPLAPDAQAAGGGAQRAAGERRSDAQAAGGGAQRAAGERRSDAQAAGGGAQRAAGERRSDAQAAAVERAPEATRPAAPPRPQRLRDRLSRTHEALVGRLDSLLRGRRMDADLLDDLEALLLGADLGVRTVESLIATLRKDAAGGDAAAVHAVLRQAILEKLRRVEPPAGTGLAVRGVPHVILVLGVNGSGKTTTIGKLAARFRQSGRSVILGAADTFRAAAIEQLQAWGERVGCEVVAGRPGGDPSAVAFDTLKAAKARGVEVAIIDTAGRLQTKQPLIEELKKLVRVLGREVPDAPHETLLVLDANTGQNAISQARVFTAAAGVTALALTKLDGTAKGGVLIGLADEFGIPVRYVGVGEGALDLRDFSAQEFVEALFEADEPAEPPQ